MGVGVCVDNFLKNHEKRTARSVKPRLLDGNINVHGNGRQDGNTNTHGHYYLDGNSRPIGNTKTHGYYHLDGYRELYITVL